MEPADRKSGRAVAEGQRADAAASRAASLAGTLVQSKDAAGHPVYLLTRWRYTREFRDLAEVELALEIMGATAP